MLTNTLARRSAAVLALALSAAVPACAPATSAERVDEAAQAIVVWPDHLNLAQQYVDDVVGNEANNIYGTPTSIYYDVNDVLHFKAECASFTTQLLKNTYSALTDTVFQTLTGSSSPDAEGYYEAINPANSHSSSSGISIEPLDSSLTTPTGRTLRSGSSTFLQVGDILASRYVQGSISGHVMTVGEIVYAPNTALPNGDVMTLSGNKAIPGVTNVRRWTVRIYDATSSVHGSTDSRYGTDPTETNSNDTGVGKGTIYLYEDADSGSSTLGQLVGWTWSTGSAYTYQFTDSTAVDNSVPTPKTTYRRMMIGRFAGL